MNPGKSLASTGVLPTAFASSSVRAVVASLVAWPRITSTSCITGTGFMKCMPMTRPGRRVRAAISVMEIELVLLARMAPSSARASSSAKSRNLRSGRSLAASTTSSAPRVARHIAERGERKREAAHRGPEARQRQVPPEVRAGRAPEPAAGKEHQPQEHAGKHDVGDPERGGPGVEQVRESEQDSERDEAG